MLLSGGSMRTGITLQNLLIDGCFILASSCLAQTHFPKPDYHHLTIIITNGIKPLDNVAVELKTQGKTWSGFSDDNGKISFQNLDYGTYDLTVFGFDDDPEK
jgi:hypothetical protein